MKFTAKEAVLLIFAITLALAASLGIIRWLAPGLLSRPVPVDLKKVQTDEKIPPFFDNIFRSSDYQGDQFLIPDPHLLRAKPLLPDMEAHGPHDILGFRNRRIPGVADVLCLGDSQTYGNNAPLEQTWPYALEERLQNKAAVVYSLAVGGWGPVEYLEIITKATVFQPRVVVCALYAGNDPCNAFTTVYSDERWKAFRAANPQLTEEDAPKVVFPPPRNQWWSVDFADGTRTVFTPGLRLPCVQNGPAMDAGWKIMAQAAYNVSVAAKNAGARAVFTIIPTKEFVYRKKILRQGLDRPPAYDQLVETEQVRIEKLASLLRTIPGAVYVDVAAPLEQAVMGPVGLYLANEDGHPNASGYAVIARTLAPVVQKLLPAAPQGKVRAANAEGVTDFYLVCKGERWHLGDVQSLEAFGWKESDFREIPRRDLFNLPVAGAAAGITGLPPDCLD